MDELHHQQLRTGQVITNSEILCAFYASISVGLQCRGTPHLKESEMVFLNPRLFFSMRRNPGCVSLHGSNDQPRIGTHGCSVIHLY
jgi:hypothetical protein